MKWLVLCLSLLAACDHLPPIPPIPTPEPRPTPSPRPTLSPVPEPSPTAVPQPPAISSLIGYSLPNGWQLQDPTEFARLLGTNHHTATQMDWTPYIGAPNVCNDQRKAEMQASSDPEVSKLGALRSSNETYGPRARALVDELRKWHVKAVINIANMNGCATTSRPDSWFNEQLNWIITNIGTDGVVLYPVSEPWAFEPNLKSRRWTDMARNAWTGPFNIPDSGGNSYTGNPYWSMLYDTLDVHYCDRVKLVNALNVGDPKSIANTDCSPVLNPGADTAAQWTKQAVAKNTNLLIYDFSASTPDAATVQAMGAQIPGGAVPQPTSGPQPTPPPTPAVPGVPPIEQITFLDDNSVGGWSQTSQVTSTSITNPNVSGSNQYGEACINHTMAGKWPVGGGPDGQVEGNPWFVANVGGQWYATTYEWLGPGTVCRQIAFGIWGKYSQYSQVQAWHPAPGELIGLFVSTLARPGVAHTSNERSDIAWFNWPTAAAARHAVIEHQGQWKRP